MKNKPVHSIRLGSIQASIWLNKKDKSEWHTVTVIRSSLEDGKWVRSDTFSRDDLPLVTKVVDMAHTWIFQQKGQQHQEAN
jgi:hypothetical protein